MRGGQPVHQGSVAEARNRFPVGEDGIHGLDESMSDNLQLEVFVDVTLVTDQVQEAVEASPAGLVRLVPWLRLV